VTIVTRAEPSCPVCPSGVNVVFVELEEALEWRWMTEQAVDALNVLREFAHLAPKVGVVHYSQEVRRRLELTSNIGRARGPLMEPVFGALSGSGIVDVAVQEALSMLRKERGVGTQQGDRRCEFVILFTWSKYHPTHEPPFLRAAAAAQRDGVTLFVGCPTGNIAGFCELPSRMVRPGNYTAYPEAGRLAGMVRRSMDELEEGFTLASLELTHVLARELQFIEGSGSMSPTTVVNLGDGRTELRWALGTRSVPLAPYTVTYAAMPLAAGRFEITGTMTLTDGESKSRELIMPSVAVTVAGPCVTPTTEPTPTATVTPHTPIPTSTATASPTATPLPPPRSIYLPILNREELCARPVLMDVVLVLDVSSSMQEETPSKLAMATDAIRAFLNRLELTDQAALVTFAGEATVVQRLTTDTALVSRALEGVHTGETTRLDLGIVAAHGELTSSRSRRGATKVMIVLTDGIPNPVPGAVALEKAEAAKNGGANVFTIGLGNDVDGGLLKAIASAPEWYYEAPSPDELMAIYARLPETVPCGPESYWP
jgi:hypothetical protein